MKPLILIANDDSIYSKGIRVLTEIMSEMGEVVVVAPIVTFDTDEEAIKLANESDFGLISYVYSGELGRAIRVAEAIDSGMVAINRGVISDPAAPFGGNKQSGLGREGGFDGIHEFLQTKYVGVDI